MRYIEQIVEDFYLNSGFWPNIKLEKIEDGWLIEVYFDKDGQIFVNKRKTVFEDMLKISLSGIIYQVAMEALDA